MTLCYTRAHGELDGTLTDLVLSLLAASAIGAEAGRQATADMNLPSSAVQIVSDLKTLRTLAEYLLILDPVTFLGYLENLRAAESINSIWLFHDAAHTIFEQVKRRDLGLALHGPVQDRLQGS